MERYLGDPVLGQFRGLSSFARNSTSDCTTKIVSRVTANKIISNLWSYRISSNILEWKYRALRRLELRERLFDRCRVDCHDEMERDLCGISYEDRLTTSYTNPSLLAPEEITNSESLILHRLRTIGGQKNIGCLPSSSDDCWETINVDKSVWNYSV